LQDAGVNQHFPWWAERSWYYILNNPEKFD
jgi:hypothetical protein